MYRCWEISQEFRVPFHYQFQFGVDGLYGKSCGDPVPLFKSRLWSCSISWERRSLKKSRRDVNSTRVEEATD